MKTRAESALVNEMVERQKKLLLAKGTEFVPNLTSDDILQPMNYPELENNPYFRYEEGILHGMQAVQAALFSLYKEIGDDSSL